LKDELNRSTITKAYFVAPKVYGLKLKEGDTIIKAKSIRKNELSFFHIQQLYMEKTLTFPVTRLFKDIHTLTLIEKSFTISDL